jgi:hypothetical protein
MRKTTPGLRKWWSVSASFALLGAAGLHDALVEDGRIEASSGILAEISWPGRERVENARA